MAEIYRCPACGEIIGEVEWEEEDVVTLAEPLQTPAEAACDPGDADTCVIVVDDSVLEE